MRITIVCVVVVAAHGCYRPDVLDGGLRCATGPSKACPDGYLCDWDNTCRTARTDGGGADILDAREDLQQPDGLDARDGRVPGTLTEFQSCTVVTAPQIDECAPGLACIEDACGGLGFGRCRKACRDEDDCSGSPCLNGVCDVPAVACTPKSPVSGCSGGKACYIADSRPSQTICDCSGDAVANTPCSESRSCFPGLLCVDPTGGIDTICLRVCELSRNGSDCPGANQACRQYTGSTGGAMTNATYGFCF